MQFDFVQGKHRGSIIDCSTFITVFRVALRPVQTVQGLLSQRQRTGTWLMITNIILHFAMCIEMVMALGVTSGNPNSQRAEGLLLELRN
jgi:hypothetical protein